jgi:hypothetical protein
MQPAERSPRMSVAAAAAAAALAAQPGADIEQGQRRAGPVSTSPISSRRRGLRGWVMSEECTRYLASTCCLAVYRPTDTRLQTLTIGKGRRGQGGSGGGGAGGSSRSLRVAKERSQVMSRAASAG